MCRQFMYLCKAHVCFYLGLVVLVRKNSQRFLFICYVGRRPRRRPDATVARRGIIAKVLQRVTAEQLDFGRGFPLSRFSRFLWRAMVLYSRVSIFRGMYSEVPDCSSDRSSSIYSLDRATGFWGLWFGGVPSNIFFYLLGLFGDTVKDYFMAKAFSCTK